MMWLGVSWGCPGLGAGSWAQQTFSTKPVYSGPTFGQAANCSFVGVGEITIGCLFLDGHNKEAEWPLFPEPRTSIQELCRLHPALPLTGHGPPGLRVRQPNPLWLSSFLCKLGVVRWIWELWGMFEKPLKTPAPVEWLAVSMVWGLAQRLGTFPFLGSGLWLSVQKAMLFWYRILLIQSSSSQDLGRMVSMLPLAVRALQPYHVPGLYNLLLFHIKIYF